MTDTNAELRCSLDAGARHHRRAFFQERLLDRALNTTCIDAGLRVTFPNDPDLLAEIRSLIALEIHGCGFLDFKLTTDNENSGLVLSITGPRQAQKVLDGFESAFERAPRSKRERVS